MSPRATASASLDAPRLVPPHSVLRLISRVRIAVMDALDAELAPYDISAAQMMVLGTIASGEADSAGYVVGMS